MTADKITRALQKAANSPQERNAFYQALLDTFLFLPVSGNPGVFGEVSGVLENEIMPVIFWTLADGSNLIPIFSSKTVFKSVMQDARYVKLRASTVFELTRGIHLILNPNTDFSKQLYPDEIAALLSGEIFSIEPVTKKSEGDLPEGTQWVLFYLPGKNWLPGKELHDQPGALAHIQYFQVLKEKSDAITHAGPHMHPEYASLVIGKPGLAKEIMVELAQNAPLVAEEIVTFEIIPWFNTI